MKTIAFIRGTGIFDDSRATKEIMALAEAGYRIEVLGWDRHGNAAERCAEAFIAVSEKVNFSFFCVRAENGIGIKNIDKMVGWIRWIGKTLKKIDNIHAVHACDLDTGLAARWFCKNHGVKLVYDIFDYYIDCHHVPAVLSSIVERMEIKTIDFADATIICTEERKEQISKATPKKVIVIHNSPDIQQCPTCEDDIDYAYCGAMSNRRLVAEILEEYENNAGLKFSFAGYGLHAQKAEQLSEKYDHFNFLGPIPYSQVLSLEARARVLAAIYEPTIRNHRLCAPNKFYEALALGKPVIVCKGTGIDKIVHENNIGYVIDYDVQQFYQAMKELLENSAMRSEMGKRSRRLYEEQYSWTKMRKKLLDMYSTL